MERIGHTSPGVALRYQHVMADRQAALVAALDGLAQEAIQSGVKSRYPPDILAPVAARQVEPLMRR